MFRSNFKIELKHISFLYCMDDSDLNKKFKVTNNKKVQILLYKNKY